MRLQIVTKGFSGFTSQELLTELGKVLKAPAKPGLKTVLKYDLVCILGGPFLQKPWFLADNLIYVGTNDLARFGADCTSKNLRDMHSLAHKHGAQTVAMSIPEHGQVGSKPPVYARLALVQTAPFHSRLFRTFCTPFDFVYHFSSRAHPVDSVSNRIVHLFACCFVFALLALSSTMCVVLIVCIELKYVRCYDCLH